MLPEMRLPGVICGDVSADAKEQMRENKPCHFPDVMFQEKWEQDANVSAWLELESVQFIVTRAICSCISSRRM